MWDLCQPRQLYGSRARLGRGSQLGVIAHGSAAQADPGLRCLVLKQVDCDAVEESVSPRVYRAVRMTCPNF